MAPRTNKLAKPAKATIPQDLGWGAPITLSLETLNQWDEPIGQIAPEQPLKVTTGDKHWDIYAPKPRELTPKEEAEEKEIEKKAAAKALIEKNLAGWPWKGVPRKLVTAGPLYLNTWHDDILKDGLHGQPQSPLTNALITSGVGELIIDLLFQHHDSMWKFAHCCQKVHSIVKATLGFWDINIAHFNGCELPPTPEGASQGQGQVAANLVVAPIRSPANEKLKKDNVLYESQLYNTYQLCKTVQYRAVYFQRLHLHRVPFLTTGLLNVLIPEMPNLKVLGIYKCPLIHIGHGMELLHIIRTDRLKGKEYHVSLDWFPNYHIGPDLHPSLNIYQTGSYGATWDDFHGDTDRAIWALVLPFLAKCKKHGIDAISSYTQFRRWLEAGPCWDVKNTLKAMVVAWGLYVEGSDLFDEDGMIPKWAPEPRFPLGRLRHAVPRIDYDTKWPNLSKAIILIDRRSPHHRGDPDSFFATGRHLNYIRPEGFEWMFKLYPCSWCENKLEGVFFMFPDIKYFNDTTNHGKNPANGSDLICLGCRLSQYLDTEKDHFKKDKRLIDDLWRFEDVDENGEDVYNTSDINKLTSSAEPLESSLPFELVRNLDKKRLSRRTTYGFDREFEERQNPKTQQVFNSKRGDFLQAPQVGGWAKKLAEDERIRKNPELAKYADGFRTSYLQHGRHHG